MAERIDVLRSRLQAAWEALRGIERQGRPVQLEIQRTRLPDFVVSAGDGAEVCRIEQWRTHVVTDRSPLVIWKAETGPDGKRLSIDQRWILHSGDRFDLEILQHGRAAPVPNAWRVSLPDEPELGTWLSEVNERIDGMRYSPLYLEPTGLSTEALDQLAALAQSWQDAAAESWGEDKAHAAMQRCSDQLRVVSHGLWVGNRG